MQSVRICLLFTFDCLLDVHETAPDSLQESVESTHLLDQHGIHALLVQRRIPVQSGNQIIILRQPRQDVGRDTIDDLVRRFLTAHFHLADVLKIRFP